MPDLKKNFVRSCIAAGLILPPFLLGGVYSHIGTNLIIIGLISAFGIVCAMIHLVSLKEVQISHVVIPLVLIGLYTLFQLIPLPASILEFLSPKAAYFNNIENSGTHPLTLSITDSWYTLARVVTLIVFASLVSRAIFIDKKKWRWITLNLIIAVSTCIIGISIVFRLFQFETWLYGTLKHPGFLIDPIIINPNHAAAFFGISGILSLLLLTKKEHKRKKLFYGTLFFLHSLAVFGTLSRGGILAYAVAVIFFLVISRYSFVRNRKDLATFLIPLLLILSTVFYAGNSLLKKEFDYERDGFFDKVANYENVFDYANDFFLTGSGAGSFSKVYPYYQDNPETRFVQLENEPVQFFLEHGLFAFLIFGIFIFIVLRQKKKDRRYKGYYAVLLFVILQNTVDFNLHNFSTLFPVTVVMILCTDHITLKGRFSKMYALFFLIISIFIFGISFTKAGHKLVGFEKETDYNKSVYLYPAYYLVPMEQTIKKMNSGKITEAIEAAQTVSAVIDKAPNYYFSYYIAGSLMLRIGSQSEALDFFRLSLERSDMEFFKTFKKINNSLKNYGLKEKVPEIIPKEHERLEEIESFLVKESENNQTLKEFIISNPETFPFGAVNIYIRNKDFGSAEGLIIKIPKENISKEKLGELYILSGKISQYRENYREAFDNFLEGSKITDSFNHLILAAYSALKLGEKEIKLVEKLLRKHTLQSKSNLATYYLWKHRKEIVQKDTIMALKSLEKAVQLSPKPYLMKNLAIYYYKNRLFFEAELKVKEIIKLYPEYQPREMHKLLENIKATIDKKRKETIKDSLLNNRL